MSTITNGVKEMLRRINDAYKCEHGYLKKLSDYNKGMRELQLNIEKLVLPTEEAKLKAAKELELKKEKEASLYPNTRTDELTKEREKHNMLNKDIIDLLKTLTEKDVIDNRTSIEILDSLDKNTTVSSKATTDLLQQLIKNADEHNEQINELLEKLNETNILNAQAMDTFLKEQSTVATKVKDLNFGDSTLSIFYDSSNQVYNLKYGTTTRIMSEQGFELFEKEIDNFADIPKEDFIQFGLIIRDTKVKNALYNNELVKDIKDAIGSKRIDSSIIPVLQNLYDSKTSKSGQGNETVIILPSSTKDLKHKLQLILASIKAGNNSNDLKNEASAIIDQLCKNGKRLSKSEKNHLQSLLSNYSLF